MHKEQADGVIKQETSSWALAAISHRSHDGAPAPSHEYLYDERAGNGTLAYVVDTGIDIHHDEFEGRAEWGVAISGGKLTDNHMDENGHGTRRSPPLPCFCGPCFCGRFSPAAASG